MTKIKPLACENCGGALKDSGVHGRYYCERCHSEYYDEDYVLSSADYLSKEPPSATKPKNTAVIVFFIIGVVGISVLVCSLMSVFASNPKQNAQNYSAEKTIPTPMMLGSLPEGVKAGQPIGYKGMEILVKPEINVKSKEIFIELSV